MLDPVEPADIAAFLEVADGPCVSVVMPAERSGRETRQGPIRLRNLLREAGAMLGDLGLRSPDTETLLSGLTGLAEDATFWQHQEESLAAYAWPGGTRWFRLGTPADQLVVVADGFHLTPLIHEASGPDRFDLLALSQNRVRLLRGRRHGIGEVAIPDPIPESLAEALWFEDREKQLQHHGADRVGTGRVTATFHGQGVPDENEEARLSRFLRKVDEGVMQLVDRAEPLVLAGVPELTSLYREISHHPTLVSETIRGNADDATPDDLHSRAWELVAPVLQEQADADRSGFAETPDLAMTGLDEILTAALAGRIEVIWVDPEAHVWGTAPPAGEIAVLDGAGAGRRDLTDLAAAEVWRRSGRVHVTDEVPGGGPVAALARYLP